MPPVNSSLPASDNAIAVMGNSVGMKLTASLVLVSQSCAVVSHDLANLPHLTYANVAIIGTADKHLFATFAHIHAIDHFFVSGMPSYPLASFNIPTRQMHVRRCGEKDFGVARPV